MADFCEQCAEKMGFKKDFDVEVMFQTLQDGFMTSCLCEGCGLVAIAKDDTGKKFYLYFDDDNWFEKPRKSSY